MLLYFWYAQRWLTKWYNSRFWYSYEGNRYCLSGRNARISHYQFYAFSFVMSRKSSTGVGFEPTQNSICYPPTMTNYPICRWVFGISVNAIWYRGVKHEYIRRRFIWVDWRLKKRCLRDRSKFTGYLGRVLGKICLKKSLRPPYFFWKKVFASLFLDKKSLRPLIFSEKKTLSNPFYFLYHTSIKYGYENHFMYSLDVSIRQWTHQSHLTQQIFIFDLRVWGWGRCFPNRCS